MTPKEKAEDLVSKFLWNPQTKENKLRAKECALIAVREIKKAVPMYTGNLNPIWKFYDEAEHEINKL